MATKSAPTVAEIFESMEYGPAPEDDSALYEWLDSHNREFGNFINGEWVFPEGGGPEGAERGTSIGTSTFPATGEVATSIRNGDNAMTDLAIASAKAAQKEWAALSNHGNKSRRNRAIATLPFN